MDWKIRAMFLHEVERQCKFALMTIPDLNHPTRDLDRTWYSVQALLVAAGNISKLLWPPRERLEGRGEELRALLSVDDNSPLAPRTFRNHFEHFDERLEEWALSSEHHGFVDSNVGPAGWIPGLNPQDYLRNFDTTNFAVTFAGEVLHLQPLLGAIQRLRGMAESKAMEALLHRDG